MLSPRTSRVCAIKNGFLAIESWTPLGDSPYYSGAFGYDSVNKTEDEGGPFRTTGMRESISLAVASFHDSNTKDRLACKNLQANCHGG